MVRNIIPSEALVELVRCLGKLPNRSRSRRILIQETAQLYGVSEDTIYRALRSRTKPRATRRSDYGQPRVMPKAELEGYCELVAALKVRTSNKKNRHLSTGEAIRLLKEEGINTPSGYVQAPKGLLKKATVNRYLKQWGYDHQTLRRQPPAVRFQAEHSNDCWHFDLSPSDLKHVSLRPKKPLLITWGNLWLN